MSLASDKPVISIAESVRYQRRQFAAVLMGFLVLPILVCLLTAQGIPGQRYTLLVVGGMFSLLALLFSSLKVVVSDKFLHWSFGPGILRKRVALAQIAHVEASRTSMLEGWGIHYTRRGWLYNVSGFEVLLVTMKDGKCFLLGTDDVGALAQAVSEGMARYSNA